MAGLPQDIIDYLLGQLRGAGESARQSSERGGQIADQYISGQRPNTQDLSQLAADMIGLSPVGAGITKTQLKAGFRPETQIARIAPEGARPMVDFTKLWPAWINEKTGEIRHAMQPILQGWHEPNTPMKALNKKMTLDPNWTRGHVDPVTWNAFPENRFVTYDPRLQAPAKLVNTIEDFVRESTKYNK